MDLSGKSGGSVRTPGDLNCDGSVGFGDINLFALALTDAARYPTAFSICSLMNADMNRDGTVDFGDMNLFVQLLASP